MLVKDYMTRHPLTAGPTMSIVEAQRFMGENNIGHLPIVGDGKRLLGLVTRQRLLVDPGRLGSLDVWEIARTLTGLKVKDVMIKARQVITVPPDTTIEAAAQIMVSNKIGCLPVVEDGIIVGIITRVDLLAHMAELMAMREPGVRVTMRLPNVKGELAKLVTAIAAQGWSIVTLAGANAPKHPGYWDVVVKLQDISTEETAHVLGAIEGQELLEVREA